MQINRVLTLSAAVVGLGLASATQADEISLHAYYENTNPSGNYGVPMANDGSAAGASNARIGSTYWNNLNLYTVTTVSNPVNQLGAPVSGAAITVSAGVAGVFGSPDTTTSGPLNDGASNWNGTTTLQDQNLYSAAIYAESSTSNTVVSLSGIPYASYEVFVYMQGGQDKSSSQPQIYRIGDSGSGKSYYFEGDSFSGVQQTTTGYQTTTNTIGTVASDVPVANYVEFFESGPNDTITLYSPTVSSVNGATGNNNFYGIQIVSTPEPATIALCGLSVMAALVRRRRFNDCRYYRAER